MTKNIKRWFIISKIALTKRLKKVARIAYYYKLKIAKMKKNIKIISVCNHEYVLPAIFKHNIPFIYHQCKQSVELHQEKDKSHTSISIFTFRELKNETRKGC